MRTSNPITTTFIFLLLVGLNPLLLNASENKGVVFGEKDSVDIYKISPDFSKLKSESLTPFYTKNVKSPDESVGLNIKVSSDAIIYSASKDLQSVITDSEIRLDITSGNIISGLELQDVSIEEIFETLELPYGERPFVENDCKELTISLKNSDGLSFNVVFRIYNHGIAFRFFFPDDNTVDAIMVQNEYTQFALHDNYQAYSESYNEWGYTLSAINNLQSLIPLTLVGDEFSLSINEAGNDSFARIALQGNENVLQSYFIGSRSSHSLPYALPWRYVVIGYNPGELAENKDMLYALDDSDYVDENWDWVKPGKVFRCLDLTTEGALESIDFCKSMNIEYMLFDSGWYGLGYGVSNDSNPDSNPMEVIDGLDMPVVTSYARENGIGVMLYIHKVAWYNYDNIAMFDLYESWGIEGLKLGFVDGYSSYGIQRVYEIIEEAGKRQMVVNVHDNFRPAGQLRKYPNLLTAEGVRGNEHRSNTGDHTTLLPFTRMLTGATDYTICYKGNDPDYVGSLNEIVTTRAHQLALSVIVYSPLQHVLWYGRPYMYQIPVETEFFKILPTVWDDYRIMGANIGDYVSIARKKGDKWFLATVSDNQARNLYVPLDFLDENGHYNVTFYRDCEPETIEKEETTLEQLKQDGILTEDGLFINLSGSGGEVAIFENTGEYTSITEKTTSAFNLYPNPAEDYIFVESESFIGENVLVSIFSIEGKLLFSKLLLNVQSVEPINISSLASGSYVITFEANGEKESRVLKIR